MSRQRYFFRIGCFQARINTLLPALVLALLAGLLPNFAHAAALYWSGSAGNVNTSVATNWSTSGVACTASGNGTAPVAGDQIYFTSACVNPATINAALNVAAVTITTGYTGIITQAATFTVTTSYLQSAGTFTGASQAIDMSGATFTINNASATFTSTSGTLTVGSTFNRSAGTFTHHSGLVVLNNSLSLTNTQDFNSLQISGTSKTVSLGSSISVIGNLTIDTGDALSSSGLAISVGGNWSNSGTFTAGAGTVTFTSTVSGRTITSGSSSFYYLTFNGVGGQWTLQDDLTATYALVLTNGTLIGNGKIITTKTWSRSSGTYTAGTSTLVITGGNVLFSDTMTFYNLTLSPDNSGVFLLGANLTVGGAFNFTSNWFEANGYTVTVAGLTTISGGIYYPQTGTQTFNGGLTISGGTFTGDANSLVDVNGTVTLSSGTLTAPGSSGTFTISGDFTRSSGTFTHNSGTVTLDGTSAQALTQTTAFNNLTINKASNTVTLGAALTVNAALTITSGTLDVSASNYAVSTGTWSNSGTFTPRSGTLTLTAAGTFTNAAAVFNLTVSPSSSSVSLGGNLTVNGALTVTVNTFTANAHTVTVTGLTTVSGGVYTASTAQQTFNGGLTVSGGTFTGAANSLVDVNGTVTLSSGTLTAPGSTGTFTISGDFTRSAGTFTHNSGTVTLDSTNAQALTQANTFNNVTINKASGTVTLGANLTLAAAATLTITAGTLDVSASNYSITAGNWSSAGTFTARSGTVTLNGTTSVNMTPGTSSFYDLTFNGSGGSWTLQGNLTATHNLTITTGTLVGNAKIISAGIWSRAGTYTAGTSTLVLTDNNPAFADTMTFKNLTVNGSGIVVTVTASTLTVNGALTITSGTLDLNGHGLTNTSGTFSNSDTLQLQGGETITGFTNDTNSGTVVYDGTTSYTGLKAGNTYYNLTFNGAGGTWILNAGLTVNGALGVTLGTLNANGQTASVTGLTTVAGTYTTSTALQTLGGGLTITGVFNCAADSDVDVNSAVTLTQGTLTAPGSTGTFTISGNFIRNGGTFNHNSGTVTLDGTGNTQTLTVATKLNNLTINKVGGTVQPGVALDVGGDFNLTSGGFNDTTYTMTFGGDVTLSSGTTYAKGASVLFDGTTATTYTDSTAGHQNIGVVTITKSSGTPSDNKVTLAGSGGMKVDTMAISTNNTLDLSTRTLEVANAGATATVFTVSGTGTLTPSTGTVYFTATNSSAGITVPAVPYYNLTVNGNETYNLAAALTGANAVSHIVTIGGSSTLDATASNYNISAGIWSNSGTFTPHSDTVTITDTGSFTDSTTTFHNLTIDASGHTVTLANNLTVAGYFSLSAGTFSASGHTATYGSNVILAAGTTYTKGTSVLFNGTTSSNYSDGTATGQNIGPVTITKTGGYQLSLTGAAGMTVDTLTISASNILVLQSYTLNLANVGATATVLTVTGTLTPDTGTVQFSATNSGGDINVPTKPYYSLQFSGGETYDLTGNLTGANAVTGNLIIDSGATLDATAFNHYGITVAGIWSNSGAFTANSNTVTLNGNFSKISGRMAWQLVECSHAIDSARDS